MRRTQLKWSELQSFASVYGAGLPACRHGRIHGMASNGTVTSLSSSSTPIDVQSDISLSDVRTRDLDDDDTQSLEHAHSPISWTERRSGAQFKGPGAGIVEWPIAQ